jgi:hypothetical protein
MNPIEIGRGKSFKGLATYLLHDPKAETAKRVGWVDSYNLGDGDPEKSWRLMVATAMSADALKEAAGKPKTGAKNTKPVYHYAITWPEEDPATETLQRTAVMESLKVLGFENHQALAVQHIDEPHPHVHVMVNLVNPEDGTTPKLSYTQKKLRKWADKFEEKHGLKITEGSRINEEKRRAGQKVEARRKSRNEYDQAKQEGQDRRLAWLKAQQDDEAKKLQAKHKASQRQRTAQWEELKKGYYARRDALMSARKAEIQRAIAQIKTQKKPQWAAEFRQSRERLERFEKAESGMISRAFNAGKTFVEARKMGVDPMSAVFAATSSHERRLMVEAENQRSEKALATRVRREIAAAIKQIKEGYGEKITGARVRFLDQCADLKKEQTAAISVQKQEWRDYRERRKITHTKMSGKQPTQKRQQAQNQGRGRGFDMKPPGLD